MGWRSLRSDCRKGYFFNHIEILYQNVSPWSVRQGSKRVGDSKLDGAHESVRRDSFVADFSLSIDSTMTQLLLLLNFFRESNRFLRYIVREVS